MLNQTQDNFCVVETEAGSQVHISYPLSHLVFEDSFNTTALSMVNIGMMNDACIEPSANDVITLSSPVVDVLTPKEAQIYPCVTSSYPRHLLPCGTGWDGLAVALGETDDPVHGCLVWVYVENKLVEGNYIDGR